MRKTLILAALTISSAGLAGCSNTQSADVATHAVYASIDLTSDGGGTTTATAALKVGGATSNDYLDLTDGDRLVASHDATSVEMTRSQALGAVWYNATFGVGSAGTPFQIAFDRSATANVSAPDSHVTLPAPFTITGPVAGASFSRATDPIVVAWSGSGQTDPMNWVASGDCIVQQSGTVPADNGTYSLPAGSIQPAQNQSGTSCQVQIRLSRARAGLLDPAYGEGGSISASQVRSITVLSAP